MFNIYRFLTIFFFPLFLIIIFLRKFKGKEDQFRYKEKVFSSSFNIKKNERKKLIWIHAASIGETLSVVPLIKDIIKKKPDLEFLITTVTLSSANLVNKEFKNSKYIKHRFFPLDNPYLIKKFLDGWKPNFVMFVDSEIWPNFLIEIKKRSILLVLINGRITKKTYKRWKIFNNLSYKVFNSFDLCLSASKESVEYFKNLNVKNVKYLGNLKFFPDNKIKKISSENEKVLNNYKFWCAASTHRSEEQFCLRTHIKIKSIYNNLLTIIVPRHINRVKEISNICNSFKLNFQILNENEHIKNGVDILIINSFGNLPMYYEHCKSVFIGKSTLKKLELESGQNPIEAAILGCKIYHGPYVKNFNEIYEYLNILKISKKIRNEDELFEELIEDLKKPKEVNINNLNIIEQYGRKILENTTYELLKISKL